MRTPRLTTNALANYAGQLTTLVVGIALTPVVIAHLGVDGYGIWVLALAVQGLGGVLDLGVSPGVIRFVAHHRAREDTDAVNRVVSTSLVLNLALGTLAAAGTAAAALWGLPLLRLDAGQLHSARTALLVAAFGLLLGLPLGVLGNVLVGLRQFEASNAVTVAQTLLTAGVMVLALAAGGGPATLIAVNTVGLAVAQLVRLALAAHRLPGFRLSPRLASRRTLREIAGYSVWLFALDVANRLFYYADTLVISAFLPVGAVTTYNIGFRPANAVSYVSGPAVAVLLPAASELEARRDTARLARLVAAGTRLALAVTLPAVLWLGLWGEQVLAVWVGPGHEESVPVLWVFLAVFLVGALQNPAGTVLRGVGRVRALTGVVCAEYAANLALSILLVPRIGPLGAAVGTLIPAAVADVAVIPLLACRALGVPFARFAREALAGPLLAALPAGLLLVGLRRFLSAPTLLALVISAAAAAVVYGGFWWMFGAGSEERDAVRQWRVRRRGAAGSDDAGTEHRDPDPGSEGVPAGDAGEPAEPDVRSRPL